MKRFSVLILALVATLSFGALPAVWETVDFAWTGDNGYTAVGSITYNDNYNIISYSSGTGVGIRDLAVSFYDSSNQFMGSFSNVTNSMVDYSGFTVSFNTTAQTFGTDVDMVAFGAGIYTLSYSASNLNYSIVNMQTSAVLDSSSEGIVVAPEPATMVLLGLGGLALRRRKNS